MLNVIFLKLTPISLFQYPLFICSENIRKPSFSLFSRSKEKEIFIWNLFKYTLMYNSIKVIFSYSQHMYFPPLFLPFFLVFIFLNSRVLRSTRPYIKSAHQDNYDYIYTYIIICMYVWYIIYKYIFYGLIVESWNDSSWKRNAYYVGEYFNPFTCNVEI